MAPTQLDIKVKALKRLTKEEGYYQQELKDQEAHVAKLKEDKSVDPYDLKKQEEVLDDTKRLLPSLYEKIREFKEDLEQFLKTYQGTEDVSDARSAITSAQELLDSK
ncbi:AQG_2a_G0052060.mRNA.1.CDS.1 [Saccharomyces cerevisiae]|jgi:tubulin-specific chaperone A|uniref:Tubulin-specific chaperone A n=4 Tax=Saccharomyces TaxID=4930 RepID=C8ZH16_YEAS8|nr:Rbl2p [Saccharomyces cerevisiae YJM993]AJP41774.1 Rbl2p [Saccharomyces cerevisiae YJM1078]AJT71196.1 Rbl2p [Saccharomyces cerevisiae YJM189]AJT72649.1 Rbl2p [Saccharomyces cerevisiae YJM244]AJT73144.1 Rbl2p [Saccharomyces cerevisiae YJM248]AJT73620.1 Rbl2p [Saccharomyces cerevisiae YJM270]AJT76071.1 Rbl2p [Saccharomyces cerevisiae YJM450]AJT76569.1 Rbl2p [Saccharomyces cerevisiae YJM451]AJT77066.1 Rbl2p [Saccharomyces cerevisiae YJM453]AJT78040.1 Rbl2p [Saccharomyces cerevisiae YJM470]